MTVAEVATRHGISERQVWRDIKAGPKQARQASLNLWKFWALLRGLTQVVARDAFHEMGTVVFEFPVDHLPRDQAPRNSSVTRTNSSGCVQTSAWLAPSIMTS